MKQTNLESLLHCHGAEMFPTIPLASTLAQLPFFGNGSGMAYCHQVRVTTNKYQYCSRVRKKTQEQKRIIVVASLQG